MTGKANRALMRVEPTKLAELARASEEILTVIRHDWAEVSDDLAVACQSLGDATGVADFSQAYAEALGEVDGVVVSLSVALASGVDALLQAAHDATGADDTVASELGRAAHRMDRIARGLSQGER